jgi:AcrR family transcriptional regulator
MIAGIHSFTQPRPLAPERYARRRLKRNISHRGTEAQRHRGTETRRNKNLQPQAMDILSMSPHIQILRGFCAYVAFLKIPLTIASHNGREILAVGLGLFIRKGFAATKISDIAEKAGMSVGFLFHYFKSKEVLFEELINIGIEASRSILPVVDNEPLAFFEDTAKRILDYAARDPFIAKMFVLINQVEHSDAANESVGKHPLQDEETYARLSALMEEGQKQRTIREGDPVALTIAYWAAIQGVCETLALKPDVPCPKSEWIVDIIRRK